jgi:hypothetical protein
MPDQIREDAMSIDIGPPGYQRANGTAVPSDVSDPRGKRIANRCPWLDLPEPFDNLRVRCWLDYPQDIAEMLTAEPDETPEQASARVMEFLKGVILQHDGWEADDNEGPLQQPDTDDFWRRIPTPLGRAISERFFEELQGNASRASRRRKFKTSRRR